MDPQNTAKFALEAPQSGLFTLSVPKWARVLVTINGVTALDLREKSRNDFANAYDVLTHLGAGTHELQFHASRDLEDLLDRVKLRTPGSPERPLYKAAIRVQGGSKAEDAQSD